MLYPASHLDLSLTLVCPPRCPLQVYADFRTSQVKLLTFLTYLHKMYGDTIRQHKEQLCAS